MSDIIEQLIRNQRALAREYTFEEDGDKIEDSWHWKAADEITQLTAEVEHLKAFISDRIHDATREEMLMEIQDG